MRTKSRTTVLAPVKKSRILSRVAGVPKANSPAGFHRTLGNAGTARLARYLQAKPELAVGAPGDRFEREADAVADRVMAMPEAAAQRQDLEEEPPEVQAQVEEEEEPVHAKGEATPVVTPQLKAELEATRGSGAPLSRDVRAFMEPRFGRDFGAVRVHTGGRAAGLARQLRAQAFTRGNNVYFASGKYAPATAAGKRLLAHELVHTIHQGGGGLRATGRSKGRIAPIIPCAITPSCIQKAEGVDPPIVTTENPLVRILRGQKPGVTYPYVNGIKVDSARALKRAFPSSFDINVYWMHWHMKKYPVVDCKVFTPIDMKSQAKVITASKPGPKGWEARVPFSTAKKVLGINGRSCPGKRGNIKVRMVAAGGNAKWAATVRAHEIDHEGVLYYNHLNYLKKYHDYVNNTIATGSPSSKCKNKLKRKFLRKQIWAIKNWYRDWAFEQMRYDGPKGPHRDVITPKVIGNCAEVLVTVKR